METNIAKGFVPFEPKYENRFIVEFPEEFNIFNWSVTSITKPKFSYGKWENMRLVFVDPVGPSTSARLYKLVNRMRKHSWEKESDKAFFYFKDTNRRPDRSSC
jgi:uncharacterized protein (DUF3820 family)